VLKGFRRRIQSEGKAEMSWTDELSKVVTELGIDEHRLPLERVMRRNLTVFTDLILEGRTWPQIAIAMTKAGARHRRGQPIDSKQLRTVYRRLVKAQSVAPTPVPSRGDPSYPMVEHQLRNPVMPTTSTRELPIARAPKSDLRADSIMSRLAEARASRAAIKRDFSE